MGLFSGVTDAIGGALGLGGGQDFNPLDTESYRQYASDVGRVRGVADRDITGLDAGGRAASDLASTVYGNQLDAFNRQGQSGLATGQAGVSRYGADAGAFERMGNQNMRQGLLGSQSLGQTNMQNQADILNRNIQQQQQTKNTAMMGLPQMSAMPFQTDVTANAANMQANQAKSQGLGQLIGMGAGAAFGGPVGMSIGGTIGGQLGGGLFG